MSSRPATVLPAAVGPGEATPEAFPDRLRPGPFEVACGLVLNVGPEAPRLGRGESDRPRVAIEAAVRRALCLPPCFVSFSGGRDSSAVLATASAVARREGLALPVPVTYRFPGAPGTREDRWQEDVVRHLGLPDWQRLMVSDELDAVGPAAQAVLRRHGVLWPFNAHFQVPLLEQAAGGSLLTGIGGDELLGPQQWAGAQAVLSGRRRPRPRHIRTVGLALSPLLARREALTRRHELRWPWLHPHIDQAINRQRAAWQARTPLRWAAAVRWWWRSRTRVVLSETLGLLATEAGTQLVQPFLEPSVVEAAARQYGASGPTNRAAVMGALFGDVLPEAVIVRRSKASFDEAFFSEYSRSFAAAWGGRGIDSSLVDVDRLAAVWHAKSPDPRSFSLLQAAWLAEEKGINYDRSTDGERDAAFPK